VLRALAQGSPVPLVISRQTDGEILYCNEKIASLFGVPVSELVGLRMLDFYYDPGERTAMLDELRAHGRVEDFEVRYKDKTGRTIWTLVNIEPLQIGGEALLLGSVHDVSRRKEIEASLQESEARFRSFVENASELVFALDRQSVFTYVSPNVGRLLGYSPAHLLGQSFDALVHADDLPRLWKSSELAQETRSCQPTSEFRMRHKDGSTHWFSSTLAPLIDPAGHVLGLTGTAHEITLERQAMTELEAANQSLRDAQLKLLEREKMASLGMLMDGIAHEIRTPLSAVSSTQCTISQALDKLVIELRDSHPEILSEPKVARLLKVLCDAARVVGDGSSRVTEIVKRLRRFTCSEQRKLCRVDINAIIVDTLALVHHELEQDVVVEKHFGEDVSVLGYPGRLNQVLVNLLVNAAHAVRGRGRGRIMIETRAAGEQIEIRISDDGAGIAPDHLPQVFARGFTTKANEQSSGYGLAISKEIVEEHQGSLELTSKLGVGTSFTIRLPRNPPELRHPPHPCGGFR
jgi:two-component system NtrC family sensor kinase